MKRNDRGRPRVDEDDDSVPVHLTLAARQYDALHAHAQQAGKSVQDVIRRSIAATHAAPPAPNKKP